MMSEGLEEQKENPKKNKKKSFLFGAGIISVSSVLFVLLTIWLLTLYHTSMLERRQQELKFLVDNAYDLVDMYRIKNEKDILDMDEAQHYAKQTLRDLRHNTTEYFFINSYQGMSVMHPTIPEIVGTKVWDLKDPNGVFLVREMVKVADGGHSGYVRYSWPKPGEEKDVLYPKITYVRGLQEWGWIIGSGVYVDDIEKTFRQIVYIAGASLLSLFFLAATFWFTISERFGRSA